MIKKLFVTLLMLIYLVSCSESKQLNKAIDYINNMDITIYEYKETKLDKKVNSIIFQQYSDISFDTDYTVVIFDCEKFYGSIDNKLLDSLYDKLNTRINLFVYFYNSKDYYFLKDTKFHECSKYYYNRSEAVYSFFSLELYEDFFDQSLKSCTTNSEYNYNFICLTEIYSDVKFFEGAR